MLIARIIAAALALTLCAHAQQVIAPRASIVDVAAR
jgi:hypothetical protein